MEEEKMEERKLWTGIGIACTLYLLFLCVVTVFK